MRWTFGKQNKLIENGPLIYFWRQISNSLLMCRPFFTSFPALLQQHPSPIICRSKEWSKSTIRVFEAISHALKLNYQGGICFSSFGRVAQSHTFSAACVHSWKERSRCIAFSQFSWPEIKPIKLDHLKRMRPLDFYNQQLYLYLHRCFFWPCSADPPSFWMHLNVL